MFRRQRMIFHKPKYDRMEIVRLCFLAAIVILVLWR
jgi:hypothetical protein